MTPSPVFHLILIKPSHYDDDGYAAVGARVNSAQYARHALRARACQAVEHVHPLDGGIIRRKYRRDRRPGLPIESPFVFYPRLALESLRKYSRLAWIFWRFHRIRRRVEKETDWASYSDIATTPVTPDELESLELYHATPAAETAVIKLQRKRNKAVAVAASAT